MEQQYCIFFQKSDNTLEFSILRRHNYINKSIYESSMKLQYLALQSSLYLWFFAVISKNP